MKYLLKNTLKFLEDCLIPAGSHVLISLADMHRNKSIWGESADQFNPDNFLPQNIEKLHPYAFLPFSAGVRNCIGYKHANILVRIMLANIIKNFQFSTKHKLEELKFDSSVTIIIKNKHLVTMRRREVDV